MDPAPLTRCVKLYLEYIVELGTMYDEWLVMREKKKVLPEFWARSVLQLKVSATYALCCLGV